MKQIKDKLLGWLRAGNVKLTKAESLSDRFFAWKWHYLITFPLLLIALYVGYFFFCFKPDSTYSGKEGGFASVEKADAAVGWLIAFICCVVLVLVIMGLRKRLNSRRIALGLVFMAGAMMLYYLGVHNFNNGSVKHDFGAYSDGGHWSIIIDIATTKEIPPVNLYNQYYQPKFFHWLYASFANINKAIFPCGDKGNVTVAYIASNAARNARFGDLTYSLYVGLEATRIELAFMGIMIFYAYYKILDAFELRGVKLVFPVLFACVIPMQYYIVGYANNDGLAYCLSLWAFYYGLKFYKKGGYVYPIACALAIAGAMEAKLNAALIALPIAFLFLIRLIRLIRARKEESGKKSLIHFIIQIGVFAILVFPLALSWHIYDYVTYDKPIGYVLELGKLSNQWIENESYGILGRMFFFPTSDLFGYIFNVRTGMVEGQAQSGALLEAYSFTYLHPETVQIDYNIWTALIKHSLFEEYVTTYGKIMNEGGFVCFMFFFAYYLMVVFGFLFVIFSVYFIAKIVYSLIKRKEFDWVLAATMAIYFVTMWVSYGFFAWRYPLECSMSSRYVTLIYLPIGFVLGAGFKEIFDLFKKLLCRKKEKAPEPSSEESASLKGNPDKTSNERNH